MFHKFIIYSHETVFNCSVVNELQNCYFSCSFYFLKTNLWNSKSYIFYNFIKNLQVPFSFRPNWVPEFHSAIRWMIIIVLYSISKYVKIIYTGQSFVPVGFVVGIFATISRENIPHYDHNAIVKWIIIINACLFIEVRIHHTGCNLFFLMKLIDQASSACTWAVVKKKFII